jgi:hypothetical protein
MSRFGRGDSIFNEDVLTSVAPDTAEQKIPPTATHASIFNNNNPRSKLIIEKVVDRRNSK